MIDTRELGSTPDGTRVALYTLRSDAGVEAAVTTYGATLQRLRSPDRGGESADVVLGFPTLDGYLAHEEHYLGATLGRYANRIGGARFVLDGVEHELSRNDGENSLHGGSAGFSRRVWDATPEPPDGVALRTTSPAGEMGYPGTLEAEVRFTLLGDALRIDYRASTDAPTVVSLSNHAYWNLAGEGSGPVDGHLLTLGAHRYTPVGAGLIPTGELAPVAGTPFDFTSPVPIGAGLRTAHPQLLLARGYDHNFVLEREESGALVLAARLAEPASGRVLEVHTTAPGVQLYTGNVLDGSFAGHGGRTYRQGDGVALETQRFPDAPNRPEFPSAVLRPGELYSSTTVYRLTTDKA